MRDGVRSIGLWFRPARRPAAKYAVVGEGMLRGLAVTGTVITSAGIVLAGTFSALAVLPLVSLTEIGFTIALGVLIDTFLVRTLLVPALVLEIGDRVWWPSALARHHRDQQPERAPSPPAEPRPAD